MDTKLLSAAVIASTVIVVCPSDLLARRLFGYAVVPSYDPCLIMQGKMVAAAADRTRPHRFSVPLIGYVGYV